MAPEEVAAAGGEEGRGKGEAEASEEAEGLGAEQRRWAMKRWEPPRAWRRAADGEPRRTSSLRARAGTSRVVSQRLSTILRSIALRRGATTRRIQGAQGAPPGQQPKERPEAEAAGWPRTQRRGGDGGAEASSLRRRARKKKLGNDDDARILNPDVAPGGR